MAGITLAEYISKRRMSLAAVDLQGSDERILDIAEKYGYRSTTAFNRAFQSFHGIAPSSVKDEGVSAHKAVFRERTALRQAGSSDRKMKE